MGAELDWTFQTAMQGAQEEKNRRQGRTADRASGTEVIPQLQANYEGLLAQNTENYNRMVNAFQGARTDLSSQLPGVYQGYQDKLGAVKNILGMGGDWGVASPAAKEIGRKFQSAAGAINQQAIGGGWANSTVLANLMNQNSRQASSEYSDLGARLANLYAGYEKDIGLAEMAARLQGAGMQSNLANAYGNALGGYRFGNTFGNVTGGYSNFPPVSYGHLGGGGGGGGGVRGGGGDPFQRGPSPQGGGGWSLPNPQFGTTNPFGAGAGMTFVGGGDGGDGFNSFGLAPPQDISGGLSGNLGSLGASPVPEYGDDY